MSRKPSPLLVGRKVKLIKCNDAWSQLPPGTIGIVESVDDIGTVHVLWEDGSALGLVWEDGDRWSVINEK